MSLPSTQNVMVMYTVTVPQVYKPWTDGVMNAKQTRAVTAVKIATI